MNKYFAYMIAVVLVSAVFLHAQQPDEAPFAAFTKEVKGTSHRWAGDKHSLSKMTKLAGQPVKVSGVIQYNFIRN